MSEIWNLILYYIANDIICNGSTHGGKNIQVHITKQIWFNN